LVSKSVGRDPDIARRNPTVGLHNGLQGRTIGATVLVTSRDDDVSLPERSRVRGLRRGRRGPDDRIHDPLCKGARIHV
jgi:hypothetical protein